jgi:MFS family permease
METATKIDPDFDLEVQHHYRYNATVNILDGTFYWFGASFITWRTILPLYVSHFTDSKLLIGLIPMLANTGYLLPQLFTVNWIQRLPRKKVAPVNVGLFSQRLPAILMVPAAGLAAASPGLALVLFLILYAWISLGSGLVAVGWQDMIAKIIPLNRRGRFFGITNFGGMATGTLGAAVAAWLLDRYGFPRGYVFCFAAAAILIFISWVCLALTREPTRFSAAPPTSQRAYWRYLPSVLRADANFRRYLYSQMVIALGGMAAGFVAVYAIQRWQLPDGDAGSFTAVMLGSQAVSNLVFGLLADRKGHKLVLELSVLIGTSAIGLASIAPGPAWFYAVFALTGASAAGLWLSGIMIVFEFSLPEERPTYIGLSNTVTGAIASLAPLLGGWLAGVVGYQVLFAVAFAVGLLGFSLLRWAVREPRHVVERPA